MGHSVYRRSVLFEIEILCILLFLNRNKNIQNSPKRMHPKFDLCYSLKNRGLFRVNKKYLIYQKLAFGVFIVFFFFHERGPKVLKRLIHNYQL